MGPQALATGSSCHSGCLCQVAQATAAGTMLRVLGCVWAEQAGGSLNSLLHIYQFPEPLAE